jgi:hypothetical protein
MSQSVVTSYRPTGWPGFHSRHGHVQTSSGAFPRSRGVKPTIRLLSGVEVKCMGLYLLIPIRLHGVVRNLTQGQLYRFLCYSGS